MRNALAGSGLVFNPGEHVNALTSPLYTYLLLATAWLAHGHIHFAATLIFFVSFAAAGVLAEADVPLSGIFLASMSFFYSLIGMETSVLIALILLALRLYRTGRWDWLPLVSALVFLVRAEAGAFILAFGFCMYRARKWPRPRAYVAVALVLCLYLIGNYLIFHRLMPQSSAAKLGQGLSGYWGRWPTAFLRVRTIQNYSHGALYTLPYLVVAGVIGMLKVRMRWGKPLLIATGIMLGFYLLFNLPNYHWYYAPFLLTLVLYSTAWMNQSGPRRIVLALLILAQMLAAVWSVRKPEPRIADYRGIGEWLDAHAAPGSTVEACEIGELGWATQRPVLDVLGLTMPKNAQHIAHRDITSWVEEDRPDYIVIHTDPFSFEKAALDDPNYERTSAAIGSVYLLQRKGDRSTAGRR